MKKAMRRCGTPIEIVTDKLRSYGAAAKELGCSRKQVTKRWANNRVENSHLPFRRRERAILRFRRMHSLQKFASIHASFHNLFNSQGSLSKRSTFKLNRDAALTEWRWHCQNKPLCPTACWILASGPCLILYLSAISKPALRSFNLQLCCM